MKYFEIARFTTERTCISISVFTSSRYAFNSFNSDLHLAISAILWPPSIGFHWAAINTLVEVLSRFKYGEANPWEKPIIPPWAAPIAAPWAAAASIAAWEAPAAAAWAAAEAAPCWAPWFAPAPYPYPPPTYCIWRCPESSYGNTLSNIEPYSSEIFAFGNKNFWA